MEKKKAPKYIYLQIDDDPCTWCEDHINEWDIKYVKSALTEKKILETLKVKIKELSNESKHEIQNTQLNEHEKISRQGYVNACEQIHDFIIDLENGVYDWYAISINQVGLMAVPEVLYLSPGESGWVPAERYIYH